MLYIPGKVVLFHLSVIDVRLGWVMSNLYGHAVNFTRIGNYFSLFLRSFWEALGTWSAYSHPWSHEFLAFCQSMKKCCFWFWVWKWTLFPHMICGWKEWLTLHLKRLRFYNEDRNGVFSKIWDPVLNFFKGKN